MTRVKDLMKIYMHIIDRSYSPPNLLSLPRVWSNWSGDEYVAYFEQREGDAEPHGDDNDYTR